MIKKINCLTVLIDMHLTAVAKGDISE